MRFLLTFIIVVSAASAAFYHLPEEDRLYIPRVDTGYNQYNTPSIHKTSKYVLTFDDGPHPVNTPKILDILKEHNAKATFFVVTSKLNDGNFPLFKRILDEGHIISNHDYFHDHNNSVDRATFRRKMIRSFLKLKEFYTRAGYEKKTFYFRFPYAEYGGHRNYHHFNVIKEISQELFGKNCVHLTFWDIDSGDWIPTLTAEDVFKNIRAHHIGGDYYTYKVVRENGRRRIRKKKATVENPTEGGVILQHDIQKRTVEATRMFLEYAKANNIEIIPLTTVEEFSYDGLGCKFL